MWRRTALKAPSHPIIKSAAVSSGTLFVWLLKTQN